MRISQLEGQRVALWGWGREGRAAYHAIRGRLPLLHLSVLCNADEAAEVAALDDALIEIRTQIDGELLSGFDVVVKSPGISPNTAPVRMAIAAGTRFIGGTALWFAEHANPEGYVAHSLCITGTKGKSTTTALLAHLLRAGGQRTALVGNIGVPLLEVLDPQAAPDYWAIELSSYQTGDVAASGARPDIAAVLNLFPEHLDWHGSQQAYVRDKLSLVTAARPRIAVLNATDPQLAGLTLPDSEVRWFNHADGWHLRGDDLYRGDERVMDTLSVPVPGRHNRGNLCAVLTVLEAAGLDARALAPAAVDFTPLPNRLQRLGRHEGVLYVNDSISTTPHATLAALECHAGQRVALLVGGHDRGVSWDDFAARMHSQAPRAIITMGENGPRIHALLAPLAAQGLLRLSAATDLADAVAQARQQLQGEGVVLMSPGAPSFGPYRDYVARGRDFARLAGFDPDRISHIQGLGIR
ncbi:UDP-N-acetylmuramoyl-L-alanine--D-glutamate ligase [Pseudoxanthomonas dokdonensis]|uniref:UDP-N-acetylmuramoyl-L-alanine--L-glutamate ligase n=1 Tax=Pseudoxanthomonas dokdonensis TaxID=344882 RepID=A0A0R0CFC6_9GAMM|nr:UDP-N-acetylmuramoyl-L-alanine--D-glutamate ligase [Pseudoxanthomonas dokdonensis]KRG68016.1 UDP-N-acetylmuramoyl-L-alanyl-D-glutamate synthetase [Pseudoxanthomonas dokdonensis]